MKLFMIQEKNQDEMNRNTNKTSGFDSTFRSQSTEVDMNVLNLKVASSSNISRQSGGKLAQQS